MLNRIKKIYGSLDVFRDLKGLSLDTVHGSDKWFIGSNNLSLLPVAKIVHVNLYVVCEFRDWCTLFRHVFIKIFKLDEFWSFVTNLTCTLTLRLSPFPLFFRSSVLLFLFFSLFPPLFCSFVPMFLIFYVPLFLYSSIHVFLDCTVL